MYRSSPYYGSLFFGTYQKLDTWNPKRGKTLFSITSARNHYGMRFINSQPGLVAVGTDRELLIINLKKRNILRTFTEPTSFIWNVDVLEETPFLVHAGDGTGQHHFFNIKKRVKHYNAGGAGAIRGICKIYGRKHTTAFGTANGVVELYNYKRGKNERLNGQTAIYGLKEDNFKECLIAGLYSSSKFRVYDLRNFKSRSKHKDSAVCSGYVWSMSVLPDHQKVLVGTQAGFVDVFDIRKIGVKLNSFKAHNGQVYRFRRTGVNEIATCSSDRYVRNWDISKGKLSRQWKKLKETTCQNCVYGMAFVHPQRIGHVLEGRTSDVQSQEEMEEQERIDYFTGQYIEQFGSFDVQLENKLVEFWKCFLMDKKYVDRTQDDFHKEEEEEEENEGEYDDDDDEKEERIEVEKETDQVDVPFNLQVDERVLVRVLFCLKPPNYRKLEGFHELQFLDYYRFYQSLGIKSGIYHIFHQIIKMDFRNPELLFLLFVQCIKRFENKKIKRMFLKKKKKRVMQSLAELVEEEEEWGSLVGMDKEGREGQRRAGATALVGQAQTSLFLFLYNLIKAKQESIKKRSEILKLFLPLLDGINRYPFQDFLSHSDFNIDWKSFKEEINQRKEIEEEDILDDGIYARKDNDDDDDDDDDSDDDEKNELDDRQQLLEYFVVNRYRKELEHLSLSEMMKNKKFWNVSLTTKGDEKTIFQTFREVLILKSPFFYRMIKFPGHESEMMRVTGCLRLDYVNKYMFALMLHFYFLGRIPLKSKIKTANRNDMDVDFDNNSQYIIALFRLLNYCDMYEDNALKTAVYKTFQSVFKKFKSRFKIINMIVSYGYLLESEKVQAQFCSNLCEICAEVLMKSFDDSGNNNDHNLSASIHSFGEEQMQRYIKESHRKYSVDVAIRKWRKRLIKVKKENKQIKYEIGKLKEICVDLSGKKKKKMKR